MRIQATVKLEKPKQLIKGGRKKLIVALTEQVMKDSNYYAPMRDGYLVDSSINNSEPEKGIIRWVTPYARRLYYNPQFNFSKDVNPNARGLWFEAAKQSKLDEWTRLGGEAFFR